MTNSPTSHIVLKKEWENKMRIKKEDYKYIHHIWVKKKMMNNPTSDIKLKKSEINKVRIKKEDYKYIRHIEKKNLWIASPA